MKALMTTSSLGGELISFKLDGIEKIHQGEDVRDSQGRVYWKRHAPILFSLISWADFASSYSEFSDRSP